MRPITSAYLLVLGLFLLSFQAIGQVTTSFTPSAPSAPVGSTVDLELKVTNFTNIISLQFPITYQSTVLQFVSADMFGLPGFSAANYNVTAGKISVSWFVDLGANPNGVTLPANTTLMRLRFTVLANGTSAVNIVPNTAPIIEVVNGSGNPVTLNYQNGGSNVTGGAGGAGPLQGFKIVVNGRDVAPNSNFCLPVTVNDFDTMVSLQYAMHWDKNVIRFDSTTDYGLPFLNSSTFGGNTANGTLLLSWYDQNALGVSRPDGDTIYQVCFKALGAVGTQSIVNIDGIGFPPGSGGAEAYKANGTNVWTNQVPIQDTVFIKMLGPDPNAPTFTADKDTVQVGGTTCVDIKVSKFTDILSAQFAITYDPAVVEFQNLQFGSNPLGLSGGANFNTTVPGQIRFTWNDPTALGVNLADGTTIFSVCFKAIGAAGTQSPFNMTGISGFPVEITQEPNGPVTPNLNNGSVFISNAPPPPLTLSFGTVTNVNCFGQTTGAINLTVAGGFTPYTVTWSGPNGYTSTSTNISNLAAGNYSVTVTSSDGQTKTLGPQAVTQPNAALAVNLTGSQNIKCWGDANGTATINVTGGTTPYSTFVWRNTGGQQVSNVQSPTNLPAGSYNVTVTDSRGCTANMTIPVIINGPASNMNVNSQKANVTCHGGSDGAINVTVTGGWGGATISWTPGTVTGFNPTGLPAGAYIPKVTDNGGCEITLSAINVTQPTQPIQYGAPTINNVLCPGQDNGSINITPSGGNGAPYTVTWNSGAYTGTSISGLPGGAYTPVVADNKNCTVTLPAINVSAPMSFNVTEVITNQNGLTANGAVDITVTGGTTPYEFNWSNGMTSEDISGVEAGQYSVTITDANDCQFTYAMEVEQDNPLNGATSVVSKKDACANDGCITIAISQIATPPFVINWNGGTLANIMTDTAQICNLMPGVYDITVSDAAGNSLALPSQAILSLEAAQVTSTIQQTDCISANGLILLSPVPVTTPMTYQWANGSASSALVNISNGSYVVTVTNVLSGCTSVETFQLNCPDADTSAVIDSADCGNTSNGAINFSFSGADGPVYTYQWSGPNGFTANTQDINGLLPGPYTVTVTDESNDEFVYTYQVPASSLLAVTNVNELSDYNGWQVSGVGVCNGSASVVFSGHNGNVNIQWSNGVTSPNNNTLCGGPYSVTVTDELGCSSVWTDELTSPEAIAPDAQGVSNYNGYNVSCFEECDGIARVFVSGGVAPYTVRWPSGQTDNVNPGAFSQAANLCGGQYMVTITDDNGVTSTGMVSISEPDELILDFATVPPSSFATCDGEVLAVVPGAVGQPEITWSGANGRTGTGALAGSLCSAERIQFVVRDANGCVAVGTTNVPYPEDGCLRVRPVLTPGQQDGKNDFLLITCIESVPNSVEIYNRWGQLVFQTDNYDNAGNVWYGTNSLGQALPEGVYYYVLNYTDDQGEHQQKGYINLLR